MFVDPRPRSSFGTPEIPRPSSDEVRRSLSSVDEVRRPLQNPLIILPHRLPDSESELALPCSLLPDRESVRLNDKDAKVPLLSGLGSALVPTRGSAE